MSSLKQITSTYKNFAKYPCLSSAKFLSDNNPYMINSLWKVNDLVSTKSKTISIDFQIDKNNESIIKSHPVLRDEEILIDCFSPSFKYRAVFLERKNTKSVADDCKVYLFHLWSNDLFLKSINLTDLDIHGSLYKNSFNFGNFQWLEDKKKIMYIAETKKSKKISFFQNKTIDSKVEVGNQFKYKRDFGEQLSYADNPMICILDFEEERVEVFDSTVLCPNFTIGTFQSHPRELGFLFTGYKQMPFNLGLVYCMQRCCDLFYYNFEFKTVHKIGAENKSKSSPRFSPDGNFVVWLENEASGAHMQCQRLMKYDFITGITDIVVDIVDDPGTEFPGIYNLGLTDNCWTQDGKFIFLTTINRSREKIISVELNSGTVKILNTFIMNTSEKLLDINDQYLLISVSSPSTVPYLAVANTKTAINEHKLSLTALSSVRSLDDVLQSQIIDHEPLFTHPKYGKSNFQSIYVSSKQPGLRPLILMLHGGPHSSFSTEFNVLVSSAVADLGFNVLMVNYRGSLGFGQQFVNSLHGYIGEMDVSDCIKACEDVLEKYRSEIDDKHIFLMGGSHGGFLAIHLAAKYANRVTAVVSRNPVINLASMLTITDIPDWNFTECGLQYDYNNTVTGELLSTMWHKSPLHGVNDIKCPILLQIGKEDLRVPMSQGLELYRALLARSIPTELHLYPNDSHPLSSVEASSDCYVNAMLWFMDRIGD